MSTRAGVGSSVLRNPHAAGRQAAEEALAKAGIDRPDFVFLFATVGHDPEAVLRAVREVTGDAPLAGCSGEGIIAPGVADEGNHAVTVMVVQSSRIRFHSALAVGLKEDSHATGVALGQRLQDHLAADSRALILLPDGLTVNFDRLRAGLETAGMTVPLYGGLAGDAMQFRRTYQFCDGAVVTDGVAGALLSGDVTVSWGINSGCIPIGAPHRVTRASGNVIYEIDGAPATDVLKKYVSGEEFANWEKAAVLVLTLAFKAPSDIQKSVDDFVIRYIPAKDDVRGSITLPTEVAEGAEFWLTRRDRDKIVSGVERLAERIITQFPGQQPAMVFQFDCAGRGKWILGDQEKREMVAVLQRKFGDDVPWIGFYSFGEIGPVGGINHFHNYTMVLAALY
jgi:hypothetical protein